jgi:hypothetical protein
MDMYSNLMNKLETIVFGEPAHGEKLPAPKLRTVSPPEHLSEDEWISTFKVSRVYILSHCWKSSLRETLNNPY